jgi:hypothetical protein
MSDKQGRTRVLSTGILQVSWCGRVCAEHELG